MYYKIFWFYVCLALLFASGCSNDTMENRMKLLSAVAKQDLETTKNLVESGVEVNYQSNNVKTGTLHP